MSENTEKTDAVQAPLPGDDATLVVDPGTEGTPLSASELRRRLGLPEGDSIEDYGELQTIGVGGMGAVFSGCEPGLMREVAIKMLRPAYRHIPERIGAFIREARTTAQISHPNIVPVHRIGVFEGAGVYFSMKRVRGDTLRTIIAKLADGSSGARKRYSLRRLLEIFVSACNGVAFAHHRGVIHCDLKPANLMVGDYGEVLVMDWGMAQYHAGIAGTGSAGVELGGEAAHDRPGTLGGTPAFMAPELITGAVREPDFLTDVYSLGAILYCILTWRASPYPSDLPREELQRRIGSSAPTPPGRAAHPDQAVPRELEAIALKAMSRDRRRRYKSVAGLLRDVHNYLDGYPVRAYSPNIVYRAVKLIGRRPLVPLVALAALLTLGGVWLWQNIRENVNLENAFSMAEYNYQSGRSSCMGLRRDLRQAVTPVLAGSASGTALRAAAARQRARTADYYNSALEFLGRIPDAEARRSPEVKAMYRDIFRDRLTAEIMSRNERAVRETLEKLRDRWPERFAAAVEADPVLRRMTRQIDAGTGVLEIDIAAPGWNKVELQGGNGESEVLEFSSDGPRRTELRAGNWKARFSGGDGKSITLPLRVAPALVTKFVFAPPKLVDGYGYIPADEEMSADGSVLISGAFQISVTEVSIGEYLDFWRSLPPERRKKCRAVLNADTGAFCPWDDDGHIRPPYSPQFPVTGITGEAAREYCEYLSKKLRRRVSLPREWQWRRAARGVDSRKFPWGEEYKPGTGILAGKREKRGTAPTTVYDGDVSPYGIVNLAGNVREFALSSSEGEDLVLILGGSYLLPPRHATIDSAQFRRWSERGDDIGFRCVIED